MKNNKVTSDNIKLPEDNNQNQIKDSSSKRKVSLIKKKIIVNVIIAVIFIVLIGVTYSYCKFLQEDNDIKLKQITQYIADLKNNTLNLETKINEGKKYKELWKSISEKKRNFDGVKVDEVNKKFNSLADSYNILNPVINIGVPEKLAGGIYNRKSVEVFLSGITMEFRALDDSRAMAFIKEFIDNLPGYIVVNNFYISKTKDYNDDDLVDISLGKFNNLAVNVKFGFSWYVLKKK